jgi:putative ABC transport system substrate-binding protein
MTGGGTKRRDVLTLLGGVVAIPSMSWPLGARAQQEGGARRVGVLLQFAEGDTEAQLRVRAIRDGLQRLGWVEGCNLSMIYRFAPTGPEQMHREAAELVELMPDVVVAGGTVAAAAMHRASSSVPIVFAATSDPIASGFVPNLAQPGGNMTGFALYEQAISAKRLELLKQIAPQVKHALLIYDPANPTWSKYLEQLQSAAPLLGISMSGAAVRTAADVEQALSVAAREPNGGVIVMSGPSIVAHRRDIIALAAHHRLPAVYTFRYFVTEGGLVTYGVDVIDPYRSATGYVDRILNGESPGNLPVQFATKYELVINLKTARALGLEPPAALLARTDEVIE